VFLADSLFAHRSSLWFFLFLLFPIDLKMSSVERASARLSIMSRHFCAEGVVPCLALQETAASAAACATEPKPAERFFVRPLEITDFHKGFYEVLSQLTVVGTVSEALFQSTPHGDETGVFCDGSFIVFFSCSSLPGNCRPIGYVLCACD
jgi:hypothetical protein